MDNKKEKAAQVGAAFIEDMPTVERPAEKVKRYGPGKITDAEALALLLGAGKRGRNNALNVAEELLRKFEGAGIENATMPELLAAGLDEAHAGALLAAFELGRRRFASKKRSVYLKPRDVWEELRDIRAQKKEHFVVFFLDTHNQEIKREIVSIGTLNYNLVHPREVFEPAVKNLAAGIIVAHNHPSGCLEPSDEDIALTKRLSQAGQLLGIELLDHVIVSTGGFMSFKEKGLIR